MLSALLEHITPRTIKPRLLLHDEPHHGRLTTRITHQHHIRTDTPHTRTGTIYLRDLHPATAGIPDRRPRRHQLVRVIGLRG